MVLTNFTAGSGPIVKHLFIAPSGAPREEVTRRTDFFAFKCYSSEAKLEKSATPKRSGRNRKPMLESKNLELQQAGQEAG